jgi:hypothetical protein
MGTEMNEEKAKEMIEKICDWLEEEYVKAGKNDIGEMEYTELAREFCKDLLYAAHANGIGGCELCWG